MQRCTRSVANNLQMQSSDNVKSKSCALRIRINKNAKSLGKAIGDSTVRRSSERSQYKNSRKLQRVKMIL